MSWSAIADIAALGEYSKEKISNSLQQERSLGKALRRGSERLSPEMETQFF